MEVSEENKEADERRRLVRRRWFAEFVLVRKAAWTLAMHKGRKTILNGFRRAFNEARSRPPPP